MILSCEASSQLRWSCRATPACSPRGFGGSSAPRWGNVYIIRRIIRHAPSGGNPSFSRLQKLTINRQFVTGEKWNYRQNKTYLKNKTYLIMTKMGATPPSHVAGLAPSTRPSDAPRRATSPSRQASPLPYGDNHSPPSHGAGGAGRPCGGGYPHVPGGPARGPPAANPQKR